jgi:surface antigen
MKVTLQQFTLLPLTLAVTVLTAGASLAAETFSVNGNMALNTNNAFSKVDGYPRMSIYSRNNSDPDQLFDRLPGNRGGVLLKHKSTGLCLNVYRPQPGKEVNTYPCNANDADQNWSLPSLGNGQYLIKRADSNWCVDSPTRNANGRIQVVGCETSNVNQRWSSSAGSQSSTPQNDNLNRINSALNQLNGQYAITDPDGNYAGQCVSFVKRFTSLLGIRMNPTGGNGGAKNMFFNYGVPGLSLSTSQADKIQFTGNQQPQIGDIIVFNSTNYNPYGHIAVVQSVAGNGSVTIEESNANGKAPNTSVIRSSINLNSSGRGAVLGWLRLKM